MTNVRTIHVDWYNRRSPSFHGGPQLAYQGDHLSNMVVFDNAPELPNYYLLVEMKTDEAGPVVTLPEILLEGAYWVIPNYYTQICQKITYQVCCKTGTGDFEHHSAKFEGTILPVIKHNGEPIDQSSMFDPYIDILDKRVNELIVGAGDIQIDSELKSDSTNPVQNKIVKAAIDDLTDDVDAVNGRLDELEQGGSGLAEDGKQALLAIARSVAYTVSNGQELYDALYNAFYPPANLVRITAVYAQSGTVTTTSSLDSLKKDLVVNAVYSDGTIAGINDYVLSGTLVSGTSTITVTYSGKTTNFTVNVIEALYMLPESTVFDGTNYIDTGVKLASVDRSYTIMFTETNGQNSVSYPFFHCMTESSPYPGLAFQKLNASGYAVAGYSRRNVQTAINPEINNTNKVVFRHEAGSQYLYVDYATNGVRGEQLIVDNGGTFAQSDNNLLIGCYQTANGDKGRFWRGIVSDFVILSNVIDDNAVAEYMGV